MITHHALANDRAKGSPDMRAKGTLVLALLIAAALACLSGAAPALATPEGEFAVFSDCPLSNLELSGCVVANSESGEFVAGSRTVPIEKTITLQGGFIEEESGALKFVGAADGNTLSKTPQNVPGGIFGIMCEKLPLFLKTLCKEFESKGITGVTATTELAGPASSIGLNEGNLLSEEGTALTLPVKIKLGNLFLGNNCYLGSNSSPIMLHLTTGTTSPPAPNKPIKGKAGTLEFNAEFTILTIKNNSLVDNAFAVPGATGCGGIFSFLVDPVVNSVLGVPAAAGHNTAILNGTLKQAGAEIVREH